MVDHIYGRGSILKHSDRPFVLINELNLYIDHIQKYVEDNKDILNDKKIKYITKFKAQLQLGIDYYHRLQNKLLYIPKSTQAAIPLQLELAMIRLNNVHI
ncbi:hypothetical protein KUH03_24615 [Sphingobacterium sp. E70]|nr:hypothetical protein [Sphingobacterium sp. E70]ULT22550.1 hypothetical protein KUH03_24615 [Sphingobacterium sp. E70]